jgi:hypothetical protein
MRNDITALEMKPSGGEVRVGAAVQLNLFALNKNGRTDLIPANVAAWSSSDGHVGEVNRQGRLTLRRAGSVKITATHADRRVEAVFTVLD